MKNTGSSFESEPMEDAAERFGGSYLVLLSSLLAGVGKMWRQGTTIAGKARLPRVETGARHGPALGCCWITVRRFEARNEVSRSSDVSRP